ncbi:hypothetical protein BURKHO8Y_350015 [Burkholderia sp. 8Y]|nr:hypothetical protein BURKHO8Y_350015 [Burkholderia sp. 8Y]
MSLRLHREAVQIASKAAVTLCFKLFQLLRSLVLQGFRAIHVQPWAALAGSHGKDFNAATVKKESS